MPAHKFVLSVGSSVFDAMFFGAMASGGPTDEIELPDVEPAAFVALLKFLYSDDVQIGPESVMTTLYTGGVQGDMEPTVYPSVFSEKICCAGTGECMC